MCTRHHLYYSPLVIWEPWALLVSVFSFHVINRQIRCMSTTSEQEDRTHPCGEAGGQTSMVTHIQLERQEGC